MKFLIARRPPIDGQLTPSSTMLHHAGTLLCYIFWYFLEGSTVRSSAIVCIKFSTFYLYWKILVFEPVLPTSSVLLLIFVEIVSSQTEFGTHPPPHTTTIRQFFFKTLFLKIFSLFLAPFVPLQPVWVNF